MSLMTRRNRPKRSRPPARVGRNFGLLVAALAVSAFYAALNWPTPNVSSQGGSAPPGQATVASRGTLSCTVAYINDGDTLRCQDGTRIRLHAVAARESDGSCSTGHPCPAASAEAATSELRRLAGGKTITCKPTGTSYDRVTAICWTPSGEEINCALIQSGVALIWERFHREQPLCRS